MARSERLSKYNQLIRNEELYPNLSGCGRTAKYAGKRVFSFLKWKII